MADAMLYGSQGPLETRGERRVPTAPALRRTSRGGRPRADPVLPGPRAPKGWKEVITMTTCGICRHPGSHPVVVPRDGMPKRCDQCARCEADARAEQDQSK